MDTPLLICNPDEPGWEHGTAHVGSVADYCRHKIRISATGVGVILTTPGMQTVCVRCIPREYGEIYVPEEIRAQFKEETGRDLNANDVALVELVTAFVAAHNPPRRRR